MKAEFRSRGSFVYLLAAGTTTLALAVTLGMRAFGEHKQLTIFLAAVAISAAAGRWRAGLLAAVLSAGSYALLIAEPIGSFAMNDPADARRLLVFGIITCMLLVFFALRERSISRLRFRAEMLSRSLAAGRTDGWAADLKNGGFWGTSGGVRVDSSPAITYESFVASVHADDRRAFMRTVDLAMSSRRHCEVTHRIVAEDGHHRWVNTRLRVHLDRSDRAECLVGASIQIDGREIDSVEAA